MVEVTNKTREARAIEIDKTWAEVDPGETFEVSEELAYGEGGLADQPDIWDVPPREAEKAAAKKSAPRKPRAKKATPATSQEG